MTYTLKTSAYNDRQYGKPWAAIVTTSLNKDFTFLDWEGRPGCAGEFCFEVEPGTMIAKGQKDHRKGRGGVDGYWICMPNGSCDYIPDDAAAQLRKMPLETRWRTYAEMALERSQELLSRPLCYQEAQAACARYSAMLGVPDPARIAQARALGLIVEDVVVDAPTPASAISMDAFGV